MAHYATTIESPLSVEEAFARMADGRNFAAWDPGITEAKQIAGDGPGLDAEYEFAVKLPGNDMDMVYKVIEYVEPEVVVLESKNRMLSALDKISVERRSDGDGCTVTYSADLELTGALDLADPVLEKAFQKIGDRAAEGMRAFLDAEQ